MQITTQEAVRRVGAIVPLLADDIRYAIEIAETMEAANRIVPPGLAGREIKGAEAYGIIHHLLAVKLALDVARMFDFDQNRDLDKQDKASVPVLIHHLKKPEVGAELVAKSQFWDPLPSIVTLAPAVACQAAIGLAIERADELATEDAVEALERIRQLRTRRLAHMLYDKEPEPLPRYGDLFLLLKIARRVGAAAVLAVEGRVTLFQGNERLARREAEQFWKQVLNGILVEPFSGE